jgi:hypothetical protein
MPSRWSAYGRLDSQIVPDRDGRFIGLDMTRDRALLPSGVLALSENKRLRNGSADTRKGSIQPEDFNVAFENNIIGSGVYSNPNANEVILVATLGATYVWMLQYGQPAVQIPLASGENLTGLSSVRFCQAFDKVLLFRRPLPGGHQTLVWDGNTSNPFTPVTLSASGSGTDLIPPTTDGEPFQSRVLIYNSVWPSLPWRDQMIESDILDYTRYDPVYSVFRINAGESDYITRIWPYYRGSVVVFKRNTIHSLFDFTLDPTLAGQQLFSKRMGLVAPFAVVEEGNDLLFLSEPGGIYRLSEVIQERVGAQPLPVSDPIQPVIDQIDWAMAANPQGGGGARAETLGDYAFFGLPLKQSPQVAGNNAIGVWNMSSRQWESVDSWSDPSLRLHALHVTQYAGARALFGLDYVARKIYVLYQQAAYDQIADGFWPIEDAIETRGYLAAGAADASSFKQFQRASIAIRTANPETYVSAISDGYAEVKSLSPTPVTKDPLKFYPHAHPDFDPATGDPLEPRRKDYTKETTLSDFAAEDFENLSVGRIWRIPPTLVEMSEDSPHQQSVERFSIRVNARWCSLRIENKTGACDVLSVGVEGTGSAMETKTAA